MSDLVQKLRDVPVLYGVQKRLNHEAADRIEALEAENQQLREQNTWLDAHAAKDEALMRQALRVLDFYGTVYGVTPKDLKTVNALRERLGEKP